MYKDKRILALVPARSGSVRIKNKNMQKVCGVSLIGWAGMVLRALDWVDVKAISTDSREYALEGRNHSLEVLMRPDSLSQGQHRSIVPTMIHALDEMESKNNTKYDVLLLVEPTAPTRTLDDLTGIINLYTELPDADAVISVGIFHKHLLGFGYNSLWHILDDSQEIYWWNGVGYAYNTTSLRNQQTILPINSYPYIIDRPVANIDTPIDLVVAEQLMREGTDWLKA